jgi:hypothetical protein
VTQGGSHDLDKAMKDQTQENAEFGYRVWIPAETPGGRPVAVQSGERFGRYLMHAESPDQSELYFEVLAYEGLMEHHALVKDQQAFLRENSADAAVSEATAGTLHHLEGTTFDFRGTLQNRWRVRRFLFVDGPNRTYRIVHDPTHALNTQVLLTLQLGWGLEPDVA